MLLLQLVLLPSYSDVTVAGNLNVTGDIVYDEVTGRNLNISGIATLNQVDINSGTLDDLTSEYINTQELSMSGIATLQDARVAAGLTVVDLTVTGEANINGSGIATISGDPTFRNLNITGLSTFAGIASFQM